MNSFLRVFAVVCLISVTGALFVAHVLLEQSVPTSFWFALAFIALLTLAVHKVLIKANEGRPQVFVTYFMGALTAKMLLSIALLVVIGIIVPDQLAFTSIGYLIAYLLMTVVEIRDLLPRMKN